MVQFARQYVVFVVSDIWCVVGGAVLGCFASFPTKTALFEHMEKSCPNAVIQCSFAGSGCSFSGARHRMDYHLVESKDAHFDLILAHLKASNPSVVHQMAQTKLAKLVPQYQLYLNDIPHSVGDIIDVKDTVGKWYEASILEMKGPTQIRIHYLNWAAAWDGEFSSILPLF